MIVSAEYNLPHHFHRQMEIQNWEKLFEMVS